MHRFQYFILATLLIQVLLMYPGVNGGEEDCIGSDTTAPPIYVAGQAPIMCYECITFTEDHFCADPFNETHPALELLRCKEYCVKWSRKTLSGKTLVQRTCSSKLDIRLRKTSVCMEESRPSEGMLCFCDNDKCNSAISIKGDNSLVILSLALMTSCLLKYNQIMDS